ncbi:MAG: hypothetical protein A2091_00805 [Desulfuromonadales bacterium GWD2_61_12]|nr:MAG: hypothetical protein A2005_02215 [Desulfuromonadales bacterium GWC2_61_20]OGR36247.1 MAG: hypothetical protein A2091_00805 [Desulfuromonadales bacterium GWD2_61_12]HAD03383.1 hypothetical protein [Desulfuromonas sp.]HBT82060.1 hypothetical protein [Desulfuromonas sp.]
MKTYAADIHPDYAESGHGPALVVIHAGADNGELLRTTFHPLAAAGFRVVVTNLRHGEESPLAHDLDRATHSADGLLDYLGIGRAVVIGIGTGGYVLYNLMEQQRGRVAGFSFVLSQAMVREIQSRTDRKAIRAALHEGRIAEIKRIFFSTFPPLPGSNPATSDLRQLRRLVTSLCNAASASDGKNYATLLAHLELPPLLVESPGREIPRRLLGASQQFGAATLTVAVGGIRRIMGLNAQLLGLLALLVTQEELDEDETIIIEPG